MISDVKASDLRYEIERIADETPSSAAWINVFNAITVIASLILFPFTNGLSLLVLFSVPLYAAFSSITTSTYRTGKLTLIQTRIMLEQSTPKSKNQKTP